MDISFVQEPFATSKSDKLVSIYPQKLTTLQILHGPRRQRLTFERLLYSNFTNSFLAVFMVFVALGLTSKWIMKKKSPHFPNIVFYFTRACLGQSSSPVFEFQYEKPLLFSFIVLAYFYYATVNGNWISRLTSQRIPEQFSNYEEYSASGKPTYVARATITPFKTFPEFSKILR